MEKSAASGKIVYLGEKSFQIQYNDENLIIDPYLKWLHTKNLLNKDDPLSFSFTDSLKHKFRSVAPGDLSSLVEHMDYVLISSPNYSHIEHLQELMEKNPKLLIVAPETLIHKVKNSLKNKIPAGVDFLSVRVGETVRFTHFLIKAVPTKKDRFLKNMLSDADRNSLSYNISCGQLRLFHSGLGVGRPLELEPINIAILPMSFSNYNKAEELIHFYQEFKPKLVIPFLYNNKNYQEILEREKEFKEDFRVYFPRIGIPLQWN